MTRTYDGMPIQAGLETAATQLTGVDPQFSIHELREMLVIDRRFTDQPGNRSRSYVEYTCRDLFTGEIITGVRRLHGMGGLTDGDDFVLRPATTLLPGSASQRLTSQTRARDTDGDRVLVGFIAGARNRAVILGVLTHSFSDYGATIADGERRYSVHKGTSVETKQDGTYVITHKSGSTITLLDTGDVLVQPATGRQVLLGDAGLSAPLDGVVNGSGIDPFTGATYAALNNASTVVLAKKT